EQLVLGILREMSGQPGWNYTTWSESLPNHGLVWLCSYRLLKERGAIEAESALQRLADSSDEGIKDSLAIHLAAKAKGRSIRNRWQEAEGIYADAIAATSDQTVRRTWHLNRAVILSKAGENDKAVDAIALARAGRGDDDIGSKVAQALEREGLGKQESGAIER